jgi:hypothetical protein
MIPNDGASSAVDTREFEHAANQNLHPLGTFDGEW